MSNSEKYIEEVLTGFQSNRGRASVYCFPPLNFGVVTKRVINMFRRKNPTDSIIIVTDSFPTRQTIMTQLKDRAIDPKEDNITVLSADYIKEPYQYKYELAILVGLNDDARILNKLRYTCKFVLNILTANVMNNEFITTVRGILGFIDTTVSTNSLKTDLIYSPVEEHRLGVYLSESDREEYDKCSDFISTSISIFGDIDSVNKCRVGDLKNNISASEFRNNLARNNGWSTDLDMSYDFQRDIDAVYNPNTLFERASIFFNLTKKRKDICTDSATKLEAIERICREHKDKRILIISKRGDFATAVAKHLNDTDDLVCGEYHDSIASQVATDELGIPILVKSGKNKGKPKIIATKAISSFNEALFLDGRINILSAKNNAYTELKVTVDLVIVTSPLCDGIIDLKTRFVNVTFSGIPSLVYKLYCIDTVEHTKMLDEKETPVITVIDDSNNFVDYDKNSGDVIL